MLNPEEIGMLSICNTQSRETAIQDIMNYLPLMQDEELRILASGILKKLEKMSDNEFLSHDFVMEEDPDDE
ncbi:MAG: hypothetical protein IKG47_06680 [Oscillospiraceae bacterium]|nr:hypothetical protein [Oscillospiraceae bacterium]